MATLTWDALGERKYEIGVDHGVFYCYEGGIYTGGVAWNGLTGVSDNNGGREASPLYSGGIKVGSEYTSEEYSGTIKCYTFPDEFEEYLGEQEIAPGIYARQQDRGLFGFCYRNRKGNDTQGIDYGYRLHLIYNMKVTDFSRSYSTVNDSMDIQETEISFESFPQEIEDEEFDPMSEIVLDSSLLDPDVLEELEEILYGTEDKEPRLPFPDEIMDLVTEPQVMPDEWNLFPNILIYPANAVYPYSRPVMTRSVVFPFSARTLPPNGVDGAAVAAPDPFIPLSATLISVTVSGIPEQYEGSLTTSASINNERTRVTFSFVNVTESDLVLDAFTAQVQIHYYKNGGG